MLISTFSTKRVTGLKRLADLQHEPALLASLAQPVELDDALTREWDSDAHFVAYHAEDEDGEALYARINKGAFVQSLEQTGGRVVVRVLVFDHDLPRLESGAKQEWSADSLESFLGDLSEAVGTSNLEPTAWYTTLHGSRFVYVLTEPVDQRDAEAMMLGIMAEFTKLGITLDPACKDWTRLFRLPNVMREGYGRYVSEVIQGGPLLDPAGVPRLETQPDELQGEATAYDGAMPDPDECRVLLGQGKKKPDIVKRAKLLLIGRDAYDPVFEHGDLVQGEENWNTQVFTIVASIVGMLSEEPCSTPEGIYALLHESVAQLQVREMRGENQTDWYAVVWDHVCRLWAKEDAKLAARRSAHVERQQEATDQRDDLLDAYRAVRPQDVPEDDDEAAAWFRSRMIASNGSRHYVMRQDGSYNIHPCSDNMLTPQIRDLGMAELIPTTEIRGKSVGNRGARDILNDHAIPISSIECSARIPIAYMEGEPGYRKLLIPVHRLNPRLAEHGLFDRRVDEWLEALGGDQADRLKEWLSHSLNVTRAICALNLYGSPGTGKGMLAMGLAECFESGHLNDGRALGKWNAGLLESPVVNCDEGVPRLSSDESLSLDQAFRSLVTGGRITIRRMREDPFNADVYPRIMFTSNDRDIINSIVGHRDLTDDDTEAIEQRLLSIEVRPGAQRLLTSKGNYSYTAGWVAGERKSDLVLANHIKHLYENRVESMSGKGRLLVEGEVKTRLVSDLRLRSKGAETVLRALVKLINMSHGGGPSRLHIEDDRVFATASCIVEYTETALTAVRPDLTIKAAGKVLRHFAVNMEDGCRLVKSTPKGATRGRWVEIDLGIVYEQGLAAGMPMEQVERLLRGQEDGPDKIAEIEAALGV